MEIKTKGRHAVRVMADIARNQTNTGNLEGFVPVADISARQGISSKYLEHIIAKLSASGLVISQRGAKGGYRLARRPEQYSVMEILLGAGEKLQISTCSHKGECPRAGHCDTQGVWGTLDRLIADYLGKVTLQDLLDKTYKI